MTGFLRDLRFAFRLLRRSPGFALGAIAILALAIGATTALFAVVDATLLRPLPFDRPGGLVAIVASDRKEHVREAFSPPDFVDFRASAPALEQVAATSPWDPSATGEGAPERLHALLVSPNFFSTLGIAPVRGRGFLPGEEIPGHEQVVVLGDSLWRRRYGADPALVGKTIRLNGNAYQVVGIAPPDFHWGRAYGHNGVAELWAPFALTPARTAPDQRGNEYLDLYGRLRTGSSLASAQNQVDALIERFRRDYPAQFPRGGTVDTKLVPLQADVVGTSRAPLWIVFGAVGLVLLIACANVAGLLLARAAGRRVELAIRISLGASQRDLLRQIFTESLLLAAAAGAAGLAAATGLLRLVERHAPPDFPVLQSLSMDFRTVVFVIAVSAATAVVFSVVPSLGVIRGRDLRPAIEGARGASDPRRGGLRRILVAGQLALATLLLVGAGLLAASLTKLLRVDPGFDPRQVITAELSLPSSRYPDAARRNAFREATLERLQALPGVRESGAVSILPMGGNMNSGTFYIEGRPEQPGGTLPHAENWAATPGYFPAMRIPLLRGRPLTNADRADTLPVVVIDAVLARRYWGGEDPVGKRIDFEGDVQAHSWRVIVGVVGNIRARTLDDELRPAFYVPFAQSHERILTFVARVEGEPERYAASIRAAVAAMDPDQPVGTIAPLTGLLSESAGQRRLAASLLSSFALAALILAAVGLYAVLAYSVARRRREIGIRIALGALPRAVVRMVLRDSATMIAAGVAAGLLAAAALTRLLSTLLFRVAPLDPMMFASAPALLAAIAMLASYLPARRASRIDPMEALRYE